MCSVTGFVVGCSAAKYLAGLYCGIRWPEPIAEEFDGVASLRCDSFVAKRCSRRPQDVVAAPTIGAGTVVSQNDARHVLRVELKELRAKLSQRDGRR